MLTFDPLSTFNAGSAVVIWLLVMGLLALIALPTFFVASLVANGRQGPRVFFRRFGEFIGDWLSTSPRRIGAVAQLTIYEAARRKALYVFVLFAILYLFAGWFTTNVGADADLALKVYVAFVLRTILWLVLPAMVLLSCWGIPEDIRLRSIHTVVTKPIRRHEVVLGRIFGYSAVSTAVVAVMGTVGYFWIIRQLPPAAQAQLEAKVPIYGPLMFRDREGLPSRAGINVGDENQFRSFIEGNTKARAIWDFYHPGWNDWKDRDVLTVRGKIAEGDQFVMTLGGAKLSVTARSTDPAAVAAEIAKAWSEADAKSHPAYAQVTATASGNTVQLTPKQPGASLAVETAVIPAPTGDRVVRAQFHTAPITLEADFQAFRTWKGNIERGLLCQFMVTKEYGVLTFPPKVPAGTLRLGRTFEVKLPAGDARSATDAIVAAIDRAATESEYSYLTTELWVPKTPDEGNEVRLLLRGPAGDVLSKIDPKGIPGVTYKHVRVEGATTPFEVREFRNNQYILPRAVIDRDGKVLDLYRDIVDDGRLRVETRCLSGGQLLGMARPDLFVRLPSKTFLETYFKACLSIALMMVVVIVICVCASTFVKGPFALVVVGFMLTLGTTQFRGFLEFLAKDEGTGGGALEGMYRVVMHLNPNTHIEETLTLRIVRLLDQPGKAALWGIRYVIPDFRLFSLDEYVATAFDIPWSTGILPCVLVTVGVAIPWIILGHFALMVRELEHK